jgi:hypothetical protein
LIGETTIHIAQDENVVKHVPEGRPGMCDLSP